jgi:uncharacterized protein
MYDDDAVFVPANPMGMEPEQALFSDFEPGIRTLPVGFQVAPRFQPLPVEIVFEKDVAVTLRDGVTIYVDVMRPAGSEKVPVIVAWSPYGKSTGNAPKYNAIFDMLGMDPSKVSGLMKFEGPDPAFWCAHGYAVCNPDPRGAFNSEGDILVWSRQEGKDYHDLIEWLAVQDWCSGKVGTSGNSYLAISQWFVAAEQPPHLAAIAPWEGMSDIYRDLVARGGIPDLGFPHMLSRSFVGKNLREDLAAEGERHPLVNALWESKIPEFEKITVPAYVVASYSNSIHTPGTFRGWRHMGSNEKWLRIHNNMEWPDYYEEANLADLRRFFDHYLKGAQNGWQETPQVRYALMDMEGDDRINVAADAFPPSDFTLTRLYLYGETGVLSSASAAKGNVISYDGAAEDGAATFHLEVDTPTQFVGYPKLRIWVEADGHDDIDLFVFLQKLNAEGQPLEQITVPNNGPVMQGITKNGASILNYKGSNGRLRVSMRHLDESRNTDEIPAHSFDRVEKLAPGEVVALDIDMFPVGLNLYPGEQLRLIVTGHNIVGGPMPMVENVSTCNRGRHIIHTGGDRASYLQIPVKRAK